MNKKEIEFRIEVLKYIIKESVTECVTIIKLLDFLTKNAPEDNRRIIHDELLKMITSKLLRVYSSGILEVSVIISAYDIVGVPPTKGQSFVFSPRDISNFSTEEIVDRIESFINSPV